jgi:hypothetical protein
VRMQRGKINRWVAIVGFATLAVGLALEGIALYETLTDPGLRHSSIERPEPMTRFLFGRTG